MIKRLVKGLSDSFFDSGPIRYQPQADFVFILGMHRSGTSCLAGCLKRCGLYLGDVQLRNPYNPRGNHELKAVEHLHESILAKNGGSWDRPPERIATTRVDRLRLSWVVNRLMQHPPCGVKDPRMLFFLDAWTDIVHTYTLIGTYRHPTAVVRSLQERNSISTKDAIELWCKYNQRLIDLHKKFQFPLLCFDISDKELYCRLIERCAEQMGLKPDMEQIRDFVSHELDHQSSEQPHELEQCQGLFAYLENHRRVL